MHWKRENMQKESAALAFTELSPGIGVGAPAPANWQSITEQRLVIIVGVTGVGKSTTLGKLASSGVNYTLLPNRRDLTDRLIIAYMQALDGGSVQPVTDRKQRFDYTRRYRGLFPGGMSEALTQVLVNPAELTKPLIFDGLRGADEVGHAIDLLPHANFIVLHAPDALRVQRLLTRNDAFDQVATAVPVDHAALGLDGAEAFFTPDEIAALVALVERGEVTVADLRAKLQIILEERRNYDPVAAIDVLQTRSPERTLVVDTARHYPNQVVAAIVEKLGNWGIG